MDIIFTRHARSKRHSTVDDPVSEAYNDLTNKGIQQCRETARIQLLPFLKGSKKGTILYIGGKSDQERTGNTGEEYGEELKRLTEGNDDILVLTKNDIENESKKLGSKIKYIQDIIKNIKNKKIVIDYPLQIKELSYSHNNRWSKNNQKTEYFKELVNKYNGDHALGVHDWIKNEAVLKKNSKTYIGPNPEEVANDYLKGGERLYNFASFLSKDRKVTVLAVGHQWDLDSVVTKSAKNNVTYQNFLDVTGGEVIGESEVIRINKKEGKRKTQYRLKTY